MPTTSPAQRGAPSEHQLLARYERLIEISQQLNSTLDHHALLRQIVAAAMELTNAEGASILLIDPSTSELRFELISNTKPDNVDNLVVPMEGSIAGWVVTHGEPRVIADVRQEKDFFPNVDDHINFTTRNILAVPMRAHNKVVGALEAVNKPTGEDFNDDDVKTLMTLAGQAAIAIENARLFQQSDFMAEMVHELRTPLAALRTSTSLLLRADLPQTRFHDIVTTMQGETERLIRMTSDFLDLARLGSGRVRLELAPFPLEKLVTECVEVVQAQAAERSVQIHFDDEDMTVFADRGKIKQVLLNLLTNAIKYNREGGSVRIRYYLSRHDQDGFAELAVADTGYGISRETQRQLFTPFIRDPRTANLTSGTGLGLAIAKRIIEAHQGDMWLESVEGQGSTFYFTLPLAS